MKFEGKERFEQKQETKQLNKAYIKPIVKELGTAEDITEQLNLGILSGASFMACW